MSKQITEENAQGGLALHSHNTNTQEILNTLETTNSQNPTFKETRPSGKVAESESSRKAGLANVNKDDIPIKNKKTKVVDDEQLDENLIAKVRELDISQHKSTDVETTKIKRTSAQDKISLSFRDSIKSSSESSDSPDSEDNANIQMRTTEFRDKEVDDDKLDDYDFEEQKLGSKEVQNVNIEQSGVQKESRLSDLTADKMCGELPDISTLALNNKEEFMHMGNLECIINETVTITGLPDMPIYDLDTLLFLDEGNKILGYIFDVMGQVSTPVYIINMSSTEAIKNLKLQKGTKVYCAPESKFTKYVFLQELMN